MYYVYLEDSQITSILNYEANVPDTITAVQISDEDYDEMHQQYPTKKFDIATLSVVPVDNSAQEALDKSNAQNREILNSTDWKVMRHIRELALGLDTSLSEEEYLSLEQERAAAASRIVQ